MYYRLEIIANQSVSQDIQDLLNIHDIDSGFSILNNVHGRGNSYPKQGDPIWPEENILFIMYCNQEKKETLLKLVKQLKSDYPKEGIKVFSILAENLVTN